MPKPIRRGLPMLLTLLGVLGVAIPAFAYYVIAVNSGAAGTTKTSNQSAPTINNAAPSIVNHDGHVDLSWSAPTTPSGAGVSFTYTVTRDGSAAGGTCASIPTGTMSCTDTGVTAGQHTYAVTAALANDANWTSTASMNATVANDFYFLVSTTTTSATAGTAFSATVIARNGSGLDTAYKNQTKTVAVTGTSSPSGQAPTLASSGSVTFDANAQAAASVTLYAASATSQSFTIADASHSGSASVTSVGSGNAASLSLSVASATPIAGATDDLTVTAKDGYGNTATGYTGDKSLTFGGAGTIGTNAPTVTDKSGTATNFGTATTITFSGGQASVVSGTNNGVMKLYKAESASITVTDGSIGNGTGLLVTVSPTAVAGLIMGTITTNASPAISCSGSVGSIACTSTGEASSTGRTLTAKLTLADQYGNAVNAGADTGIDLSVPTTGTGKDGSVSPSGASALTITNGTSSTSASFTLTRSSGQNNTATLTATIHGTTQKLTVTLAS